MFMSDVSADWMWVMALVEPQSSSALDPTYIVVLRIRTNTTHKDADAHKPWRGPAAQALRPSGPQGPLWKLDYDTGGQAAVLQSQSGAGAFGYE
jgi:hypothetical protein